VVAGRAFSGHSIERVVSVSQRESGYAREERDRYETPAWVTLALAPHLPPLRRIWEPACGTGKMVKALRQLGLEVEATDIDNGTDFLSVLEHPADAIITNPPYALAQEFIERALLLTKPRRGFVAMLLRCDYDHARTRAHLFHGCKQFTKKLVLTRRIVWFDGPNAAPSFNHAWFIWRWDHSGPPTIAYDLQAVSP
jgi:hypothetical protein